MNSRIAGIGTFIPDNVVTNADLTKKMETSHEWIEQRTGIQERHWIDTEVGPAELGAHAARAALADAKVALEDIDLVIFATLSPDHEMPSSASILARHLGIVGTPAFDVRNQCSGFLYCLAIADASIRTGASKHVLIVGGEVHSTGVDQTTRGRDVAVIFGDGAAAVVMAPEPDPTKGILTTHLHSEGKFAEKLWLEAPTCRRQPRMTPEMLEGARPPGFPQMEGRYVFKHAVTRFPEVIREALDTQSLQPSDIDLLIPHQANLRISQAVAMGLELRDDQVFNNIERYGNTTAASIPLALSEALDAGRVQDGTLLCLAAFGAGFTWGSALIRW